MASSCCGSLRPRPVIVEELDENGPLILSAPFISSLIFVNEASDARDHCANERTFLSWLRLSVYMTVVSVAIVLSFHLKSEPTSAERRMAYPLGIVFWFLSLLCLFAGLANYLRTIGRYSRKAALVQSGIKTQSVFVLIAVSIVVTCIILLSTER